MMKRKSMGLFGGAVCAAAALLVGCGAIAPAAAPVIARTPVVVMPQAAVIERLEVRSRVPAYGGARFGAVGEYEVITAVAYARARIGEPRNAGIVDLALAVADAAGWVSYRFDVVILRPRDATRASRVMLYDVVNRGDDRAISRFNDGKAGFDAADKAGNGYLMQQGYTLVWSGWQGDVGLSGQGFPVGTAFPVARQGANAEVAPVTGLVAVEEIFNHARSPATFKLPYARALVAPGQAEPQLTVKPHALAEATRVAVSDWAFRDERTVSVNRPAGFDAGAIYELVYTARDPVVMGLGFAAARDLLSWLRSGQPDASGAANPLADLATGQCVSATRCRLQAGSTADVVIGFGNSQSGRYLRDFLYQGFNADLDGRPVFDGLMIHVAGARRTYTNARWAQPGRFSREHEDHFVPGDQFPFSYAVTRDPVTGRSDGLMKACEASRTCPKVFQSDSSLEFWQARAALLVTDGVGGAVALLPNVRAYLLSSSEHAPDKQPKQLDRCSLPSNPLQVKPALRALLARMVDWTAGAIQPPASRYPTLADGTLTDPLRRAAVGFPDLSALGLPYTGMHNTLSVVNPAVLPFAPQAGSAYRISVPTVDADGNDRAGIRLPDLEAPLATHTGWNLRSPGFAAGHLCSLEGSYLPLARSAAQRELTRDPRLSLTERYPGGVADRTAQVERAALALQADGLLLPADVAAYVAQARLQDWR